jgi:membrane-associated phospholipid phosphatase
MGPARRTKPRRTALAAFAALCVAATSARAQERDLSEKQRAEYYLSHGVITGSAILSTYLLYGIEVSHPRTGSWFSFEDSVERNFSPTAAGLSDALLLASVLVPLVAQTGEGGTTFGNSMLVYGETLSLSLWLNGVVKYSVRRARPYTHHPNGAVGEMMASHRSDEDLSFYSGHASTAFSAFVSGGLIYSATHADPSGRRAFWGVQAALAASTAHLRVRAGRHYYSDVLVGAAVGSALGALVPYASGVRYHLDAGDWAAVAGGLVVGSGLALVMPTDELQLVSASGLSPRIDTAYVLPTADGTGWLFVARGAL